MGQPANDRNPVAVTLAGRHWITVLASLDLALQSRVLPEWELLKKRGMRPESLSEVQRIALTAPIFARAAIATALHEAGIVTAETNLQAGTDALNAIMRRFENERSDPPQ